MSKVIVVHVSEFVFAASTDFIQTLSDVFVIHILAVDRTIVLGCFLIPFVLLVHAAKLRKRKTKTF